MSRSSLLDRLDRLDRRWMFLIMLLAMAGPLLVRVRIPIRVSAETRGFYQAIENLSSGDVIFLSSDYDPGGKAELDPMLDAVLDHLFRKNVKVVSATLWPAGPSLLEQGLHRAAARHGKRYGVDYVHLGFKEGKENVMVQLGKSIRAVFPVDYYGTPVDSLPLVRVGGNLGPVESLERVPLLVNISVGYPGTREWVQQVRTRFSVPMVAGCTAVSAPEYYPYVQSGQLAGLLGGLAGAAEYEGLIERPGWATTGMSAQSLGHVTIVLLVLMGNVVYYLRWRRDRAKGSR